MDPIRDRIRTFIQTEIIGDSNAAVPGDEDSLLERGLIDSMGLFRLVTFIEQEIGVILPDTALLPRNFATISAIERVIREHGG